MTSNVLKLQYAIFPIAFRTIQICTNCKIKSWDGLRAAQGRSDGGGYWYLYPPKSAQVNFLWGKMTSERLFNSFIHPQKLLCPPSPKKKQISGYAPGAAVSKGTYLGGLAPVPSLWWKIVFMLKLPVVLRDPTVNSFHFQRDLKTYLFTWHLKR